MTSALYSEHYIESLENLFDKVQQNLTQMRDLDSRTQELSRNIDKQANDYISNVKGYSVKKKNKTMRNIQRQFANAKKCSDNKVRLALSTYELADNSIRKLDLEIAQLEAKMQGKSINVTIDVEEGTQKRGCKKTKHKQNIKKREQLKNGGAKITSAATSKTSLVSVVTHPTNPINSVASVAVETSPFIGALVGVGVAQSSEVLEMPVDPNEPTYCSCKQVSYGRMIACDNPDCHIEWFHFACVKLITKPKGKWFCPKCITNKKKK